MSDGSALLSARRSLDVADAMMNRPPMSMRPDTELPVSISRTSEIVAAYVSKNAVPAKDLSVLIDRVHAAFLEIGSPPAVERKARVLPNDNAIAASLKKDHLVSFIDGKPYKMLKRHLKAHGLDPRSYRERYGLPADYPMVATSYARQRALLAKRTMDGVATQ